MGGSSAVPTLGEVAILHYVGRDKPWQRLERSTTPDTPDAMCRRLRSRDAPTCTAYLRLQQLWWSEFGKGACLLVGEGSRSLAQGFVIEQFETIL